MPGYAILRGARSCDCQASNCQVKIAAGSLRLGIINSSNRTTASRHLTCITARMAANILQEGEDCANIPGSEALSEKELASLRATFASFSVNATKKPERDPDKPVMPKNAYQLWYQQEKLATSSSGREKTNLMSLLSAKWKTLNEEIKQPYVQRALTLKAGYDADMEVWREAHPEVGTEATEKKGAKSSSKSTGKKRIKRTEDYVSSESEDEATATLHVKPSAAKATGSSKKAAPSASRTPATSAGGTKQLAAIPTGKSDGRGNAGKENGTEQSLGKKVDRQLSSLPLA